MISPVSTSTSAAGSGPTTRPRATGLRCLRRPGRTRYEPRREAAIITLANCPFDALARDHTELVCGMNLVLVGAVADQVGDGALAARLGRPTTAAASCWVPADRAD